MVHVGQLRTSQHSVNRPCATTVVNVCALLFLVVAGRTAQCEDMPFTSLPVGWTLAFEDEFTGNGPLKTGRTDSIWRFETMQDALHRAGNTGLDDQGRPAESWRSPTGKRWSAWYDKHHHRIAYRDNGELVLGGYVSSEPDPTRPVKFLERALKGRFGSEKLYTVWIDTYSRVWTGPGDRHVVDPQSPAISFRYGYFETRVNFSKMRTPGFRLSMWLMPASSDEDGQALLMSHAYDANGDNGVEMDIFEYEWIGGDAGNRINLAVQGGAAGKAVTNYDLNKLGIQLNEGYHTIGFLWQSDKLVWTLNGHVLKTVRDEALIPDVFSYLIVSREMNSGVKSATLDNPGPDDVVERLPYLPRDPGLYARNIWQFKDRINEDKAVIDYIRVWQPPKR